MPRLRGGGPPGAAGRGRSSSRPTRTFPTVPFPNPEEPGAMDLVIALAVERGAAVALANDPDADRLGAAIPQPDGSWRRIGGDELGWLLADHILRHPLPDDGELTTDWSSRRSCRRRCSSRWRPTTACTSPRRSPASSGSAARSLDHPRVAVRVRLRAGARLPRRAAPARQGRHHGRGDDGRDRRPWRAEDGTTLQARLDEIAARYGRHVIADRSVPMEPARAAELVRELLADPPDELGGAKVVDVTSYPRGRPAAPHARGRGAGPGPPERHRTQGQAVRRRRSTPTPRPTSTPSPPSSPERF